MSPEKINYEAGVPESASLKKPLLEIWFTIFSFFITWSLIYLILKITGLYEMKHGLDAIIGGFLGGVLIILTSELKPRYIYRYKIEGEDLYLFLVSIFGKKRTSTFSIGALKKIKYRKGNLERTSKIWFHFEEHVNEYSFIDIWLGQGLCDSLDVEKL